MVFLSTGEILLNGNRVTFETDEEETEEIREVVTNARCSEYSNSPFKSTASKYTTTIKTISKSKVSTGGDFLKGLTTGSIATILANRLKLAIGGQLYAGFLAAVADSIKETARAQAPTADYMSYKLTKKQLPGNYGTDLYYKYAGFYYAQKDYKGKAIGHTFYEYNYFV